MKSKLEKKLEKLAVVKLAKKPLLHLLGKKSKLKHMGLGAALLGGAGAYEASKSKSDKGPYSNMSRGKRTLMGAAVSAPIGAFLGHQAHSIRKMVLQHARAKGRFNSAFRRASSAGPRSRYNDNYRGYSYGYRSRGAPTDFNKAWKGYGINPGSIKTKKDFKQAFRQAARKHHPDLGGDAEKMKDLNSLWEKFQNSPGWTKLSWVQAIFKQVGKK